MQMYFLCQVWRLNQNVREYICSSNPLKVYLSCCKLRDRIHLRLESKSVAFQLPCGIRLVLLLSETPVGISSKVPQATRLSRVPEIGFI